MLRSRLPMLIVALAIVFALGVLSGVILPRLTVFGSPPRIYSTATLLQQVQTLSQLVTVKYVMEKVVVLEDVKWFGESRVLLLAHGVVKAGVDLSELRPEDLRVREKRIEIILPPARITDNYLDDTRSKVVERTTGLLRTFDKDLEQTARQRALDEIRRAARLSGILKDADERARDQLSNLFRQLGFEEIEFRAR